MRLFINFNISIWLLIAFCFLNCSVNGFSVVKVRRSSTTAPAEVFATTSSPTEAAAVTIAGLEDEEDQTTSVWEIPPNGATGIESLITKYFIKVYYVD